MLASAMSATLAVAGVMLTLVSCVLRQARAGIPGLVILGVPREALESSGSTCSCVELAMGCRYKWSGMAPRGGHDVVTRDVSVD